MKLDRNIPNGHGNKYGLIKNRRLAELKGADGRWAPHIEQALMDLTRAGVIDLGDTPETEFFVIRLKDRCAGAALTSYAIMANTFDQEYAAEVHELADRSGYSHPSCKKPD